jgi:hypothetical protein
VGEGQGQEPYDESGGFTPYQPSDVPQGEPADQPPGGSTPETPFVPYGSALPGTSITPYVASTPTRSWGTWLVGIGIVVAISGGIIAGIVGFISEVGSDSGSDTSPEVVVPDIDIPSFTLPTIDFPSITVPSIDIPTPSVPTQVFANDLRRGQCLVGVGFDPSSNNGISALEVTECAGAHNAQVLDVRVLSSREASNYDFADNDQGNKSCFPLFSPAQRELFRGDKYTLLSFTETARPSRGDKVACLVVRSDGAPYRGFLPR